MKEIIIVVCHICKKAINIEELYMTTNINFENIMRAYCPIKCYSKERQLIGSIRSGEKDGREK